MSLQEVVSLEADVTYSLGKLNKKTGKKDPGAVEGYYLGRREVDTRLGKSSIHFFKTSGGNVAVWGTTDLNRKLQTVIPGTMAKAEFAGMKSTPRGDMRSFKVYQDKSNTIEVDQNLEVAPVIEYAGDDGEEVDDDDDSDVNLPSGFGGGVAAASSHYGASSALSTEERAQKLQNLLIKNKKK